MPLPHCETCGKRLDLCDCPEKDEDDADYLETVE